MGILINYKSSKIKMFLVFLFLAIIFWILSKFSKDFTTAMEAPIIFDNVPETATIAKDNVRKISFDLTANGFEILFYKFKKPSIHIDVAQDFEKDKGVLELNKTEILHLVTSRFNRNLAIKNLSIEKLEIHLDPIVLKKVKVVAKTALEFKKGFKAVGAITIVPDSVKISGPSGTLKDIKFIETELISENDIDNSISANIKLFRPGKQIEAINPDKVTVKINVSEFSQGQIDLQVKVINLPPNVDIKLVQKTVMVLYDISIGTFSNVTSDDFRVVCDYSKKNSKENFMIPLVVKKPKGASNIEILPKKIDFLIFK